MTKNRVIGHHNKMPWHLPAELQYFKRITMGHPIIMGRKTYDSIGRPLPGRRNIVVTRNQDFTAPGIDVVHSLREAIALCGSADAFITGGAALYAEALPLVDRLYITEIDAILEGDTFFPELNPAEWQEVSRDKRPQDAANPYDVALTVLARRPVTNTKP
jgi:dihydrofolate reductase